MSSRCFCLVMGVAISSWAAWAPVHAQTYRVMALGDSITQGIYGYQSYRYPLWVKLINGGISIDYVGSMTENFEGNASYPNYRGRVFNRRHEGHAGWRAQDLLDGCTASDSCHTKNEGYLSQWLAGYTPDIVLLHIGSNDIFQSAPQSATVSSIHTIINTLRADNPNVILLLAQIIPLPGSGRDPKVRALNAQIATIVATRTTSQSPVYLVDQYTGFSRTAHTFDGTHPNAAGEERMAQRWYDAMVEALNPNDPPVVDAGRDRWASAHRVEVNLAGTATDDGNPAPPGSLVYAWTQLAGPPATVHHPTAPVTTAAFPIPGDYQFLFSASDGELVTHQSMVVHMQPFSCPRLHHEANGRVVFEAEKSRSRSHGRDAFAATYWDNALDRAGYSGTSALAAHPTYTRRANAMDTLLGAHVDYWVAFSTPGTYYAWVRMLGPAGNANSIHLGLNGAPLTFGLRGMEEDSGTWQWVGTANAQPVRMVVNEPGRHRINVWMREDGTYIDKIILDQDAGFQPTGLGPAVSDSAQVCDFDEDGMDDTWELARWPDLGIGAGANADGDAYLNGEEYIAGTDPEDPLSFPVIVAPGAAGITLPSAGGRYYQLESRDPAAGEDEWIATGPEQPGTGGPLTLTDPSPAPSRLYRFRVRSDPL